MTWRQIPAPPDPDAVAVVDIRRWPPAEPGTIIVTPGKPRDTDQPAGEAWWPLLTFTVPGPPVGKSRARITRNGRYTPKKTRDYQMAVATEAMAAAAVYLRQTGQRWPVDRVYRLHVVAVYSNRRHPDGDNVWKSVADALNRLMYADDRQVHAGGFELRLGAEYGEPRAEITLEVMG